MIPIERARRRRVEHGGESVERERHTGPESGATPDEGETEDDVATFDVVRLCAAPVPAFRVWARCCELDRPGGRSPFSPVLRRVIGRPRASRLGLFSPFGHWDVSGDAHASTRVSNFLHGDC